MAKKKVTLLDILKIMFKRVRVSTLLLLVITFASTSFAWFIYSTKVTAGISAHIESWQILFTDGQTELSEYINFVIPNFYPGMENYSDQINVVNMGERQASIRFEIVSVSILGTDYICNDTDLTSDMMVSRLANNFPFHITFGLTNNTIDNNHGTTTFSINTSWPYESGNDEWDTTWGNTAYTFNQNNPTSPGIEMVIKITAIQSAAS